MPAVCQSLSMPACHPRCSVTSTALRRLFPRLRQPHGFYVICMVVFFERWAAAILSSSIVFMLCERYGYSRSDALQMAGLINAANYLGTLPGGFAVDRVLGSRRALHAGMAFLALGYAVLIQATSAAIWLSSGLLMLGHALFKPSTQAILVRLYTQDDVRLDAAQTAFYLTVNAGITVGALVAGFLMRFHNWRVPFAVATAVLLAGRIVLALGRDLLLLRPLGRTGAAPKVAALIAPSASQRVQIIGLLTLAMMLYAIGCGQVEGSLLLWAQDRTDRTLLGFEIPAAWFVGLPAFLVLALAPMQLMLLPRIQRRMDTRRLIVWGLVALALAFAVLVPPSLWSAGHRVSMAWLLASIALLVVGELLVAPLGLSMLLRLTPPRLVGVAVGAWYGSGALGYWLAGEMGAVWLRWAAD